MAKAPRLLLSVDTAELESDLAAEKRAFLRAQRKGSKVRRLVPANIRERKSASGSIGCASRDSTKQKAISKTADAMRTITIFLLLKPTCDDSISP
jgi:hypothetical protein